MFNTRKQELIQQLGQDTVFDALLNLMRTEGLEGLTMQKVASQAGMAIGTLYKFFKSKEELLNYADQRLFDIFLDETCNVPVEMPPDQKLRFFTRAGLNFFLSNIGIYVILERARLMNLLDKEQETRQKDYCVVKVQEIVQQGIDTGIFRQVDTHTTAGLYLSLLIGYFHVQIEYRSIDIEVGTEKIHEMMMRYLMN